MKLTLTALARAKALFAAGASVEEVFEALSPPPNPSGETSAADLARNSPGLRQAPTDLGAEISRLAGLLEDLRQDMAQRSAERSAPGSTPAAPSQADPATVAPAKADPASVPPGAVARDEPPRRPPIEARPQGAPVKASSGPAPDLRDQIAVAVTRISMMMGSDDDTSRRSGDKRRAG